MQYLEAGEITAIYDQATGGTLGIRGLLQIIRFISQTESMEPQTRLLAGSGLHANGNLCKKVCVPFVSFTISSKFRPDYQIGT